jgi:NAD(P)H-hydrate epimerase
MHKGELGRVLVIGGARGMVGAVCMASDAALRAGAGLVKAAVPECVWDVAAAKLTCVMTSGFPCNIAGTFSADAATPLVKACEWADVVALGPGFGRTGDTRKVVRELVAGVRLPLVIDADGLYNLEVSRDVLKDREHPTVLTPHPGEMAHLLDEDIPEVQQNREQVAAEFAAEHGVVCVLKGKGTVVTDGERRYINTTGNPGMATGGTGDVLTGLIAALIGEGLSAYDAAVLGVYLHGLAGDIAAAAVGVHGLIATDVLYFLPQAFLEYASG